MSKIKIKKRLQNSGQHKIPITNMTKKIYPVYNSPFKSDEQKKF